MKNLSIIITLNEHPTSLKQSLLQILSQDYDGKYEVVVVRESRQGEVMDILEPMCREYPNLRTTYVPDKPLYIGYDEVMILLGVKAASYDDIVVISYDAIPLKENWLTEISDLLECNTSYPILFGMAHLVDYGFFQRRRHRKALNRLLKPWCRQNALRPSDLYLCKQDSDIANTLFHRKDYLEDLTLRAIIAQHCKQLGKIKD